MSMIDRRLLSMSKELFDLVISFSHHEAIDHSERVIHQFMDLYWTHYLMSLDINTMFDMLKNTNPNKPFLYDEKGFNECRLYVLPKLDYNGELFCANYRDISFVYKRIHHPKGGYGYSLHTVLKPSGSIPQETSANHVVMYNHNEQVHWLYDALVSHSYTLNWLEIPGYSKDEEDRPWFLNGSDHLYQFLYLFGSIIKAVQGRTFPEVDLDLIRDGIFRENVD